MHIIINLSRLRGLRRTASAVARYGGRRRRERDSNPRYAQKDVQRFSKPSLSATQPSLHDVIKQHLPAIARHGGRTSLSQSTGGLRPP